VNVIVNGLLVHYERRGKGKSILMLHGWGDNLHTFDGLVQELGGYDIIRLDLAGFGASQPPDGDWGLDDYARYVAAFMAKINLKPYAILGHSNGGAIVMKGLASGQLKADKLILLSSAGVRAGQSGRKFAWKLVARTGKTATRLLPTELRQSLRSRLYRSAGSDLLVAPHLEGSFKKIVNEDVQTEASMLSLPTLIIAGKEDTATPPKFAEAFHKEIAGSKLVLLDDAGHFAHQEHTGAVAPLVKEFLK
jgi:pimeloyl-ACP methyl ester carboxylesterase